MAQYKVLCCDLIGLWLEEIILQTEFDFSERFGILDADILSVPSGVFTHEISWPAVWILSGSIEELAFVTEHCLDFFIHYISEVLKLVWVAAFPTESSAYFVGLEPNFDEVWVMGGSRA